MKIKTQSFILIMGVALMPLIVVSLSLLVESLSTAAREARHYEMMKLDSLASPEERIARIIQHKPKDIDMAIAGPNGVVVFSTINSIAVGADFAPAIMRASHNKPGERLLLFGLIPELPHGYTAITSVLRYKFLSQAVVDDYIKVGALALAAILLFTAIMCIFIIRSITKSVVSLEAATRRVASGELDLPIAVEGSNEIASLSRSLNSLREEIKDDQSRRARFIMGISHDLKTPLALIKGYAEALDEELGEASDEARSHLGIIESKADQLEGMIEDLIDFERVDTGEWSRGLKSVDLGVFLRAFAKRAEEDALLLGRTVRSSIDLPGQSMVPMDERLATRAIENLVNNALRYTNAGGSIDIVSRVEEGPRGRVYLVSISDDGPGISAEDLPHIFEPFYRGSSSRREQGMGLGLSIVKTVVESHGWEIESRPGRDKGVVFILTIPSGM
jgi:signal transduction histidine kinase